MAAKKKAPKRKAAKKKVARKTTKKAAPARKITAIRDKMTKTQILTELAEKTELSKKQVEGVMDEL